MGLMSSFIIPNIFLSHKSKSVWFSNENVASTHEKNFVFVGRERDFFFVKFT